MLKVGDSIKIGSAEKKIARIITLDGAKWEFEDKSWLLLRPSGTEPKFRYYYEIVGQDSLDNIAELLQEYNSAANGLLAQARKMVN